MSIYRIAVNGKSWEVRLISRDADGITFAINDSLYSVQAQPIIAPASPFERPVPTELSEAHHLRGIASKNLSQVAQGEVRAPISGSVIAINVAPGAAVTSGQTLVVLEAMKMENPVKSTINGVVERVAVTIGADVKAGQVLLQIAEGGCL